MRSGHDYSAVVSSLGGTNGIGGVDLVFMTDIDVKFQYKGARCVPYSLLNLLDAHRKKKDKLMAALGTGLCSLSNLCAPVQRVFRKRLEKVYQDLDWVVSQTHGKFLVFDTIHCVGVDCDKGLIFDASMSKALRLCKDALRYCDIQKGEEIRIII